MPRKSKLEKDTIVRLQDLTEEIRKISQLGKAINSSDLNRRALSILISEMTKVSRSNVILVLDALPKLEQEYLK